MMNGLRPLTQGVDYDAKIAIYDVPVMIASEADSGALSAQQFCKNLGIPVTAGEALASVHIWSEKESVINPDENTTETWTEPPGGSLPMFRGSYKFPTEYPINRLVQGREGDVIEVPYRQRTYRFLCSQKESTDGEVNSTRLFQNALDALKEALSRSGVFGGNSCSRGAFDFSKYLTEFLENNVPKIDSAPKEIPLEITNPNVVEVIRQFQISVARNHPTLPLFCGQLRKRLIVSQEPGLWYNLYGVSRDNKDRHASLKELFDICVAMANYRPDILEKYSADNSLDKLERRLQTTSELKDKIAEAKSLNCQIVVRRIKQMLGL